MSLTVMETLYRLMKATCCTEMPAPLVALLPLKLDCITCASTTTPWHTLHFSCSCRTVTAEADR